MSGTCTYHNGDWTLRTAVVDGTRWLLATDVLRGLGANLGGHHFRFFAPDEATRLPRGLIRVRGAHTPLALSAKGLRRYGDRLRSFATDDAPGFLSWAQGIADCDGGAAEARRQEEETEAPDVDPIDAAVDMLRRRLAELDTLVDEAQVEVDDLGAQRDRVVEALEALETL